MSDDKYRLKAHSLVERWLRDEFSATSSGWEDAIRNALAEAAHEAMERAAQIASSQVVDGKYCVSVAEAIRKETP